MDENGSIAIFVATHVSFCPPSNPIYVPLHVGREGKEDLGYIGDNIGDNISDLNFLYGELTGLYWIWRNISGIDYAGLCHYRRFFLNDNKIPMQRSEYLELLTKYDVLVPKFADCEESYIEHYGKSHNKHDLEAVGRAIHKLFPEYDESFQMAMQSNKYLWGNLFVTKLSTLKEYASWLFAIFAECSEEIDVSTYDAYHRRVYGFLSEQMLYVYLLKNKLSYCSVAVGVSEEKAETRLLKEQVKILLEENKAAEAKRLFDKALAQRPDLLLEGSDIYNELRDLKQRVDTEVKSKR